MTQLPFVENFVVDASLALVSKTVEAPFHNVKLNMLLGANLLGTKHNSGLDCAKKIVDKQGYAGLWRGNLYKCVRYFPPAIVNLALMEKAQSFTRYLPGYWQPFLSGYIVGCISLLLVHPFDYAVVSMIMDEIEGEEFTYTGIANIIWRETKVGPHRLYKGFTATVIGIAVHRATYYAMYAFLERLEPSKCSLMQCFQQKVFLQVVAGFVSFPLDTIRRKQIAEGRPILETIRSILEDKDPAEFFKGYDLRMNICIGVVGVLLTSIVSRLKNKYVAARCK